MGRRLRILWGVLSITGIVVSVILGAGGAVAATIQEQEPNDGFETAQVISEGRVAAEMVDGESDFYRIEADATDAVDLMVDAGNGDLRVRLYDTDRNELASAYVSGSGRVVRKLPETGTYYVEVAGTDSEQTTNYTLDYQRVTPSENDAFAPNDDFESATTLPEGFNDATIWGGESDFYAVEASATDALDLEIDAGSGDLRVRVYDTDRNELASAYVSGSGRVVRKLPEAGTYYVEVAGTDPETTTDYTLDYERITASENDAFAPNDDFESATTLPEGFNDATIWGGESDFYRIRGNTTDAIDLRITLERGDARVRLYDTDRNELASAYVSGSGRVVRKVPKTGTYYVEVAGADPGTTTDYTLDYERVTPSENDVFAPNDDFSSAAPITERFSDATIWGGESDFYAIEADEPDTLGLKATPERGDLRVRVYDADRNELASEYVSGSGRVAQELPRAGIYYVEVAGADSGTTTDYTLRSNQTSTSISVPRSDGTTADTATITTPRRATTDPSTADRSESPTARRTIPDSSTPTGDRRPTATGTRPPGSTGTGGTPTGGIDWVRWLGVAGSIASIIGLVLGYGLYELYQG